MSQTQSSTDATVTDGPRYFDLHTTGVGYLSRVREVKVKKGEPFLCVDISALRGTSDAVEYTRFDCRVSGEEAASVLFGLRLRNWRYDIYRTKKRPASSTASRPTSRPRRRCWSASRSAISTQKPSFTKKATRRARPGFPSRLTCCA